MNKTRLIFVRHAKSTAQDLGIVQGRGLAIPLSDDGKKQAKNLAKNLQHYSFCKILTSTAMRAVDTADAISKFHPNTPVFQIPELNERSKGSCEGMLKKEFEKRYPKIIKLWNQDVDVRIEGGESLQDVEMRVFPVIEGQIKKSPGGVLFLYVVHGNVIRAILGKILNVPPGLRGRIRQDYCAVNSVHYDHELKRWGVDCVNQTFKE